MKRFIIERGIIRLHPSAQDVPCDHVRIIDSPFFNARPQPTSGSATIDTIVIHNISLPPGCYGEHDKHGDHYVTALFTGTLEPDDHPYFRTLQGLEVSAHFFILRTGALIQYVSCDDRAWHAGKSSYLGRTAVNDFSIGIELEGTDYTPFTDAQYDTLAQLIIAIYDAYPTTRAHLTGHSDIAPVRKTDPGVHFDWLRLRRMVDALVDR